MHLQDHYSAACPKDEDTAGMGTYSLTALSGQTQMNIGMLTYFGSNFYQPLDNNDLTKWILFRASNGERPILALRHYGNGS